MAFNDLLNAIFSLIGFPVVAIFSLAYQVAEGQTQSFVFQHRVPPIKLPWNLTALPGGYKFLHIFIT